MKANIKNLLRKLNKKPTYEAKEQAELVRILRKRDRENKITLLVTFAVLLAIFITVQLIPVYKPSHKDADIVAIDNMMKLDYTNATADNSLPHNALKSFDWNKDKLSFKNFSTINSSGGICRGIAVFEKLNYMNKLKDYTFNINGTNVKFDSKLDLSKIQLSTDEINKLYGVNPPSQYNDFKDGLNANNRTASLIFDMDTDRKILENFSFASESSLRNSVLCAINYLKVDEKLIPYNTIEPREYKSSLVEIKDFIVKYLHAKGFNTYTKFSPDMITSKIDNDEPVMVGFTNEISGHAVLAYKYEFIDKSTMKVYVDDSNLVLLNEGDKSHIAKVNADIKNNYILFKLDAASNRWEFIYNPRINGSYMYKGIFNSYIPETYLFIQ